MTNNGILSDRKIAYLASTQNMICPFESTLKREVGDKKVISYGLSSYGYDITLSKSTLKLVGSKTYDDNEKLVIDPKSFSNKYLKDLNVTKEGYFLLPEHSYALGVSVEKFNIPPYITAIALGKSTYARSGILINVTPLEAGWKGYLTIEIANLTSLPCRVYSEEGIAQLLFFQGERCATSYSERCGKYQDQPSEVVLPKV